MSQSIIYKGWIPTASGRLSYSFIGESEHPKPTTSGNIADQHSRHIICCQHRPDLLDSAIPLFKRLSARFFFGIVSDFWFICVARCDNKNADAPLKGTLYLIEDTKTWKRSIRPAIDAIFEKLDEFSTLKDKDPDDYVKENNIGEQIEDLEMQTLYSVQFSLERNGVVTIFPLPYALIEEPKTDTESYRNDILEHRLNQDAVCAQLFYFLKDIVHTHQHHRPTTDTLAGLYSKLSSDESNLPWINKTLKTLYAKVLEYKRDKHEDNYPSTLGLLAYIDAFVKIAKKKLNDKEHNRLVFRNHDTLKASIHASQLDHQADASRRAKFWGVASSSFFSIIGVLIATASLGNLMKPHITINIPNELNLVESLANLIINHTLKLLICIIPISISFALVNSGVFNRRIPHWVRDIKIIVIVQLESISAAIAWIFLALLVLMLCICLYLTAPEIADWLMGISKNTRL